MIVFFLISIKISLRLLDPFLSVQMERVRQQFNGITGFLDNSNVYGSNAARQTLLRAGVNGLMAVNPNFPAVPGIIPPFGPGGSLVAGDLRVEEQPGLTTIHNLFFREHNRLAREILAASPLLGDEVIFQTARRLVNAQWQHIVFHEWLPFVLGEGVFGQFGIQLPMNTSESTTYDPFLDPSIVHAFATAAFRFGHSLIQGAFELNNPFAPQSAITGPFQLCNNFANSDIFLGGNAAGAEYILTGLINQPMQSFDRFITTNLTNHLFPQPQNLGSFGQDLMARNIQRGRDHGLPGYTAYRAFCGLSPINSFCSFDRPSDISVANFALLANIYSSPADIDLWVGGTAENFVQGGMVGATFACLIGEQFRRLLFGDRFFFTHAGQAGSYTAAQRVILRTRTLRDVICLNSPVTSVREDALLTSGPLVPCTQGINNLPVTAFLPGTFPTM